MRGKETVGPALSSEIKKNKEKEGREGMECVGLRSLSVKKTKKWKKPWVPHAYDIQWEMVRSGMFRFLSFPSYDVAQSIKRDCKRENVLILSSLNLIRSRL